MPALCQPAGVTAPAPLRMAVTLEWEWLLPWLCELSSWSKYRGSKEWRVKPSINLTLSPSLCTCHEEVLILEVPLKHFHTHIIFQLDGVFNDLWFKDLAGLYIFAKHASTLKSNTYYVYMLGKRQFTKQMLSNLAFFLPSFLFFLPFLPFLSFLLSW